MNVRTRYAPSPTGYAHIGFVSRVLINYALAKKNGGQFVWRNEDTDQERFIADSLEFNMKWVREFGLDWDEGPDKGGPYAPYNQTERLDIYKKYSDKLIENGYAYRCFCSKERLDEMREIQRLSKQVTHYDGKCRALSQEEIDEKLKNNESYTIRIKMPRDGRKIEFNDAITNNHVVWNSNEVDDYIIVKSNGIPTYHLAAMVDDIEMKISHALRGSEWLATTPVHIMIYEGLGIEMPKIGHFTVILDPNTPGKKFSKRNSAFKANGLVLSGYMKPAILNYLMLLGWAPKDNREVFTLQEFIDVFDLNGMQKANPNWNQQKMDWFNGIYMRELSKEKFAEEIILWIDKYLLKEKKEDIESAFAKNPDYSAKIDHILEFAKFVSEEYKKDATKIINIFALLQERSVNFLDALMQIEFFFKKPGNIDWEIKQLNKVDKAKIPNIRSDIKELMSNFAEDSMTWTHEEWEKGMRAIGDKYEVKHGDIFMILRLSVVGSPFSPPLFESMQVLGKDEVVGRV